MANENGAVKRVIAGHTRGAQYYSCRYCEISVIFLFCRLGLCKFAR